MNKFLTLLGISLFSCHALAMDLQEALVSAYNNNEDLKNAKNNFLAAIESSPQAISEFLPDISASMAQSNNKQTNRSRFGNRGTSSKFDNFQKNISINQSLFNGGGSIARLKAADSDFKAAKEQYYVNEQKVMLSAIKTYLDYYENKEKFNITETSVNSNKKQLEAVQEKLYVGETTETEVAKAKAALSNAETKKASAYANFRAAEANFIKTFDLEPKNIIVPTLPKDLPTTLDTFLATAIANNQTIGAAKHARTASKAREIGAKSGLSPSVGVNVAGYRNFNNPETISNQNSSGVTTTLSVKIPILSKGGQTYSDVRRAKNETRSKVIQLDDIIKQVNANCIMSWENFNTAKYSIKAAEEGVEAAQIAYDGTMQEELLGTKTIVEVLIAEDALNQAKINKVENTTQYILAGYQIKSFIGQLTANNMKLKVKYFNPENEFKKAKIKVIGF
ncbi:MAG: TolC family protein [Rickettsiaceae bacterium]|nr:MAG: TolC family protein [Rickettsiaceae bacterium]